jgi:L-lysine 2,3-aminomutase
MRTYRAAVPSGNVTVLTGAVPLQLKLAVLQNTLRHATEFAALRLRFFSRPKLVFPRNTTAELIRSAQQSVRFETWMV